jgi:hypothetical protein
MREWLVFSTKRTLVLVLAFQAWTAFAQTSRNLIEVDRFDFMAGTPGLVVTTPPEIQVRTDGRIVFERDGQYWVASLDQNQVRRLERSLARNRALRRSRYLHVRRGPSVSYHGGMQWYRYGDGVDARLIVMSRTPARGPVASLAQELRSLIPDSSRLFVPDSARISFVEPAANFGTPANWPFRDKLDLAEVSRSHPVVIGSLKFDAVDPVEITDGDILRFLFERGVQHGVTQDGRQFVVVLHDVPGWMPPALVAADLFQLWMDANDPGWRERDVPE